ncbi:DEAD/DEAH box helicase [Bacillus sp. 2205SS5-2]|uniref:DEAD/DEAH box helicase n=1 Tax=Bacillus sp. 2205SS5-2 TaxID=3109031 RepID=UPI003007CDCF
MSENVTMNWSVLKEFKPFLQAAWKQSEFPKPTSIQSDAIPAILEGKDVICESPTGTGKTLAYLMPILEKINPENQQIQAVILAPSRELVMQIHGEIQTWTKESGIKSASFIGGANVKKQVEKLKNRPQVIVGTTGRILELIKSKKMKMHEVKMIVADEADQLTLPEHRKSLQEIIKTTLKDQRQLLFFSATIGKETEQIAQELMDSPALIKVQHSKEDKENVNHLYLVSEQREKIDTLRSVLHTVSGKVLVFINDVQKVGDVQTKLGFHKIDVAVLDGGAKKQEREAAIRKFRNNAVSILLVTDLAARGLDISDVSHIIQLDIPRDFHQYVHRSGRTGRMGAKGQVISIVSPQEERDIKRFCKQLGVKADRKTLYRGNLIEEEVKKEEKANSTFKKKTMHKKKKK